MGWDVYGKREGVGKKGGGRERMRQWKAGNGGSYPLLSSKSRAQGLAPQPRFLAGHPSPVGTLQCECCLVHADLARRAWVVSVSYTMRA